MQPCGTPKRVPESFVASLANCVIVIESIKDRDLLLSVRLSLVYLVSDGKLIFIYNKIISA